MTLPQTEESVSGRQAQDAEDDDSDDGDAAGGGGGAEGKADEPIDEAEQVRRLDLALGDRRYAWIRPPDGTVAGGPFRVRLGAFCLTLRTKPSWRGGPVRVSRSQLLLTSSEPLLLTTNDPPPGAPLPEPNADEATSHAPLVLLSHSGTSSASGSMLAATKPVEAIELAAAAATNPMALSYAVTLPNEPGALWATRSPHAPPPLLPVSLPSGELCVVRLPSHATPGSLMRCRRTAAQSAAPSAPEVQEAPAAAPGDPQYFEADVPPSAVGGDVVLCARPDGDGMVRFTLPETWKAGERCVVRVVIR